MAMNAEARRNAALREIERHCSGIAEASRRTTGDVVDGEFVARDGPDEEMAGMSMGHGMKIHENVDDRTVSDDQRPQASR